MGWEGEAGVFVLVRGMRVSSERVWAVQLPTLREKGTTMLLTVYLCGWLITTVGVFAAGERVRGGNSPTRRVLLGVGVGAGALWPVVFTGLVQAAAVAITKWPWRVGAVRDSGLSSIQLKEVLAFSS